jgi:dethiobiotin synthase
MLRGLFITGADTNVGKTVLSAAVLQRFRHVGTLRYWKPIQTGIEQDDDTAMVKRLSGYLDSEFLDKGVRLPRPVSPHLAAQLSHTEIRTRHLLDLLPKQGPDCRWIVEGAGGVLVPINGGEFMIDFMRQLGLPVLVAVRSSLGTINHTLLTVEALRARKLKIAGIVMIGEPNSDNRRAIEQYGNVDVVGEMPWFSSLTKNTLREWATAELDPENRLSQYLS